MDWIKILATYKQILQRHNYCIYLVQNLTEENCYGLDKNLSYIQTVAGGSFGW